MRTIRQFAASSGGGGGGGGSGIPPASYSGILSVQAGTVPFYNDTGQTLTITSVRASVGTAPAGAAIIVDVNKNGTTIFTTQSHRPSIAAAAKTAKVTTIDVATLADGDYLTFDVDQVGSSTPGSDLVVTVVTS